MIGAFVAANIPSLETAMTIDLKSEQQHVVDLAMRSGAYRNPDEVISTALSMLVEDLEDGVVSVARSHEPRFTLAEVESELRSLDKLK